jgi:hypothetical protein
LHLEHFRAARWLSDGQRVQELRVVQDSVVLEFRGGLQTS